MAASREVTSLTDEDARILALECGHIRGHVLKVLIIDDAPDEPLPLLEALRASIVRRLPAAPRWRQRLVSAPGAATGLAWSEDPDFDIERHVRLAPAPAALDGDGFRRVLADIMIAPLDRSRPLWTLDLVPRVADGRWALVWKVHHCLADGTAMMHAGARLLWTEAHPQPPATVRARPGSTSPFAQIAAGMRLVRVFGYRGLFLREFRRVRRLSPLAGEVGSGRSVGFTDGTLEELRAIGRNAWQGVTINDVLVAAVAGGLRRWLLAHGVPTSRMKAMIPVSMRQQDVTRDSSGNRDSFLLIDLPIAEPDPVARLRRVSSSTRVRKNRHDARAIQALRHSLRHAPEPMQRTLQQIVQGPHQYSLNISNVPGPTSPIEVLGHRVDAMYPVVEVSPHHALRVAAVSLDGRLFVGLCADPRVVPDLESLAQGMRRSIDELSDRLVGAVGDQGSRKRRHVAILSNA